MGNLETEFIFRVEQGEEKLFEDAQGCAHPAVTIPGAEEVWSSGQAKPRGGSFVHSGKLLFFSFYQNQVSGK